MFLPHLPQVKKYSKNFSNTLQFIVLKIVTAVVFLRTIKYGGPHNFLSFLGSNIQLFVMHCKCQNLQKKKLNILKTVDFQ